MRPRFSDLGFHVLTLSAFLILNTGLLTSSVAAPEPNVLHRAKSRWTRFVREIRGFDIYNKELDALERMKADFPPDSALGRILHTSQIKIARSLSRQDITLEQLTPENVVFALDREHLQLFVVIKDNARPADEWIAFDADKARLSRWDAGHELYMLVAPRREADTPENAELLLTGGGSILVPRLSR